LKVALFAIDQEQTKQRIMTSGFILQFWRALRLQKYPWLCRRFSDGILIEDPAGAFRSRRSIL
jgi:hypothetical protein